MTSPPHRTDRAPEPASSLPWWAVGLTAVVLFGLTGLKWLLAPYVGASAPFLLYFAPILLAAWYGGWRVGLFATAMAGVLVATFFLPPLDASLAALETAVQLLVFTAEGAAITLLTGHVHSARRQASVAAREAQLALAKLETVLGGVDDGITVQDERGKVIFANPPAARLVGYPNVAAFLQAPPREVLERFELLAPDGTPFPLEELPGRRVLAGHPAREQLIRFRARASGEERWSLVRATPVQIDGTASPYAVNVFHDVTDKRRHDEELRLSREWFSTALRSIGDAVIATDGQAKVTFLNPPAERLTGWSAAEAEGKPLERGVSHPERGDARAGRKPGRAGAARRSGGGPGQPHGAGRARRQRDQHR